MKTIVITGSTSGIGNALTKAFAKDNIVFAGYRNEDFVNDLKDISENVIPFYINMENKSSIAQAAAFIRSKSKNIDTIINAAGCVIAGVMENIDVERIRTQFEVNTFGHLDFSQRLLDIVNDNGKIINISSMASFGIFPFVAPYCASKRALDILFNAIQLETHKNIKIISIKPGVIATPLWGKSVNINSKSIKETKGFDAEMNYLVKNALKNEHNGLDVKKVVDLIVKVENMKKPKPSYTVGSDAKWAEVLSKFPQSVINKIVRFGLKYKINHQS